MDLLQIRRTIVTALASDDVLVQSLILKGGNALQLAYSIGNRGSVDLDYSMKTEFGDLTDTEERLRRALADRFDAVGLVVLDFKFGPRPPDAVIGAKWAGYRATFKLCTRELSLKHSGDLQKLRMAALPADSEQGRSFKIDISRYEYVDTVNEVEIDDYLVRVYTPSMIAAEKLRALCQQMKEYPERAHPAPRARDLYDIHSVVLSQGIDVISPSFLELVRHVFAAKNVALPLLGQLANYREFHRDNWAAVQNSVSGPLESFDFYFDYVLGVADQLLKATRVEDSPV